MERRNFLRAIAACAGGVLLSRMRIGLAEPGATDPFWIHVHADGGWDQALSCDPKPSIRSAFMDRDIYVYGVPGVGQAIISNPTASEVRTTPGGGIKYLGFADFHAGPGVNYAPFFPTYHDRITIFNGVDTGTNNHDVGARYSGSGSSNEGFPCFATQVACARGAGKPLAFLNAGGYDETAGLIAATPMNGATLSYLLSAVNPNDISGDNSGQDLFMDAASLDIVRAAQAKRIERLSAKLVLPGQRRGLMALKNAAAGQSQLAKLKFDAGDQSTTNLIRVGMEAYRQGLAVSLNLSSGGFDSHMDNEQQQAQALFELFELLKFLIDESEKPQNGKAPIPAVIVVTSDFGRTAHHTEAGTDHWPVSSVMVIQNQPALALNLGIPTDRAIGGTTDGDAQTALHIQKINPTTLWLDSNGVTVTPEHVLSMLRRVAGIADSPLLKAFPLDVTEELAIG